MVIDTQNYAKSQSGRPGSSPLRSDGSRGSQAWRLDCVNGGHRHSRKSRLTISQGVLKKGDVGDEAVEDDEVRTSAPQNRATVAESTEEFFLSPSI